MKRRIILQYPAVRKPELWRMPPNPTARALLFAHLSKASFSGCQGACFPMTESAGGKVLRGILYPAGE